MTPEQQVCNQHFHEAWIIQIDSAKEGRYCSKNGLLATYWQQPLSPFNRIYLQEPPSTDTWVQAIEAAKAPYEARNLCWELCLHTIESTTLSNALTQLGLTKHYSQPGMILERDVHVPNPSEEMHVFEVSNTAQLAHFNRITAQAYNLSPYMVDLLITEAFMQRKESTLLTGWVDRTLVCIASLIETESCTGIYWVATHSDHLRNGYAEQMTRHAIHIARQRGASTVTLQASESGLPLYEKMGFKTVLNYDIFIPKPFSAISTS